MFVRNNFCRTFREIPYIFGCMLSQGYNQDSIGRKISNRCSWLRNLLLVSVIVTIMSCSSDKPRVGDWYQQVEGKRSRIRIAYLGTGGDIADGAKGKSYRYVSGADTYQDDDCFAYEDSAQVLWEKIRFLTIEPVSDLKTKYMKVTVNTSSTPQN